MKILVIIIGLLCLIGCNPTNSDIDKSWTSRINKSEIYEIDIPEHINTRYELQIYIEDSVVYKSDGVDNWQTAQETWRLKTGDCEDFCILYINLLYSVTGEKASLIAVDKSTMQNTRTIVKGGIVNHMLVQFENGDIYSPQNGKYINATVGYKWSFEELFN